MTAPVFREILEQNPDLEIVMVSRGFFKDVFDGIPRLIFKGINVDDHKGYFGLRRLSIQLKEEFQPDIVADLHQVIRSKIMNSVFRNRGLKVYKLDKGKEEKKLLTDIWNINKSQIKMTTERYADVFREMGYQVNLSHQLRPLTNEKNGVGFAPFAQHEGKVMPQEKAFELARVIAQHKKVYFFGGGKAETSLLSEWEKDIPNSESLAGKLSLNEELRKISELEVMISMDSANMHLASVVGTRCISVWAQTHHYAGFLGYGQSENDIVHVKDLTCRPCSVFGDKECYRGDWACRHELNIQQVIDKIQL